MRKPLDYPDLITLEALMQLMLIEAQIGNWAELTQLDGQRRALLKQDSINRSGTSSSTFTPDDAYHNLAIKIEKLDKEIIATVVKTRDGLADENKVLRDQVKAKASYQQASSITNSSRR